MIVGSSPTSKTRCGIQGRIPYLFYLKGTMNNEDIDFIANAHVSQKLKDVIRAAEDWKVVSDYKKEALERICSKIGKLMTGDSSEVKTWRDIQAFAQLVVDELPKQEPKKEPTTWIEPCQKCVSSNEMWRSLLLGESKGGTGSVECQLCKSSVTGQDRKIAISNWNEKQQHARSNKES